MRFIIKHKDQDRVKRYKIWIKLTVTSERSVNTVLNCQFGELMAFIIWEIRQSSSISFTVFLSQLA